MRRIFGILAVSALVLAAPVAASSAATVTPSNPNGWSCIDDSTDLPEPCNFVTGPATPPLGVGSVQLSTPTAADRHIVATSAYAGTALSNVSALDYWTYQPGPTLAISLQFDIRYHPGDTVYGGRLVFEPYQGSGTVGSGWQHWNAQDGLWWASKTTAAGSDGLCPQAAPCTWNQVLANWPGSQFSEKLLLKAGGNWPGFTGNADALTVGVSGANTTYDFEPSVGPPASKDSCKNDGWRAFNNPTFKNQGACVSSVASGGNH
jgi:hypothetical protein